MNELRGQFQDINKQLITRQRLFNLKQRTSVQQFTTQFRHLQCELADKAVDDDTAMHLYLYGLKEAVQIQVMLHLPNNFEDMVLLAERADQAFMVTRRDHQPLQPRNNKGGNHSGPWDQSFRNNYRPVSNSGTVNWNSASQYNNLGYRGPAPMVLGAAESSVCYQCGQQGHLQRSCPQLSNRGSEDSNPRGRPGGQSRGQARKVISMLAEAGIPVTEDLQSILHLGAAALVNQQHQRQPSNVKIDGDTQYSESTIRQSKN